MNFSEENFTFLVICFGLPLLAFGAISLDGYQKNMVYQQAYDKNMECRQTMKGNTYEYIDRVCGKVPEYRDFVK